MAKGTGRARAAWGTDAIPGWRGAVWFCAGALLCLGLGAGCHSTEKSQGSGLASIVIHGNTPGQIRRAALEVFGEHSFLSSEGKGDALVFEKRGSPMNNFAYGSWMGDEPVWVRVKLSLTKVGEAAFRVDCTAWMVQDRGRAAEEELPVTRLHRGKYRELLEEVAARLGQKTAADK